MKTKWQQHPPPKQLYKWLVANLFFLSSNPTGWPKLNCPRKLWCKCPCLHVEPVMLSLVLIQPIPRKTLPWTIVLLCCSKLWAGSNISLMAKFSHQNPLLNTIFFFLLHFDNTATLHSLSSLLLCIKKVGEKSVWKKPNAKVWSHYTAIFFRILRLGVSLQCCRSYVHVSVRYMHIWTQTMTI